MLFLILGWINVRERISTISMVRSVSTNPLAIGRTRYNSIPRIELGSLRIPNWRLEVQDVFFDMDNQRVRLLALITVYSHLFLSQVCHQAPPLPSGRPGLLYLNLFSRFFLSSDVESLI
jgi:hypothetical protein